MKKKKFLAGLLSLVMAMSTLAFAGAPADTYAGESTQNDGNSVSSDNAETVSGDCTVTIEYDSSCGTVKVVSGNTTIKSGEKVSEGTELKITATANDGYELTGLKVNDTDFTSSGTGTHKVTGDVNITATFAKTYNVTNNINDKYATVYINGEVVGYNKVVKCKEGDKVSFGYVNAPGFSVGFWIEDENEKILNVEWKEWNSEENYDIWEFEMPEGNVSINGYPEVREIRNGTGISGTIDDSKTCLMFDRDAFGISNFGDMTKIEFDISFEFDYEVDWVGGVFVTSSTTNTWKEIDRDNREENENAEYSNTFKYTWAMTSEDYDECFDEKDEWQEIGFCTYTSGVTTVTAVRLYKGDTQVFPVQAVTDYTVTFATPANGTITVEDSVGNVIKSGDKVSEGTKLTIKAVPNTGYKNASLTVNGKSFTSGDTYTVNENVEIAATFAKKASSSSGSSSGSSGSGSSSSSTSSSTTTTTATTKTVTDKDGNKVTATVVATDPTTGNALVTIGSGDSAVEVIVDKDGNLIKNQTVTIGDDKYITGDNGEILKDGFYYTAKGNLVYAGVDGKLEKGEAFKVEGHRYKALKSGKIVVDDFWTTEKGNTVYSNANGRIVTKKLFTAADGNTYYAGKSGKIVKNKTKTIKGVTYKFDKNGHGKKVK